MPTEKMENTNALPNKAFLRPIRSEKNPPNKPPKSIPIKNNELIFPTCAMEIPHDFIRAGATFGDTGIFFMLFGIDTFYVVVDSIHKLEDLFYSFPLSKTGGFNRGIHTPEQRNRRNLCTSPC